MPVLASQVCRCALIRLMCYRTWQAIKPLLMGLLPVQGDGQGTITGTVDWTRELQAKLKLQGKELQVSQPPAITAIINPILM